jgi:putative endonuclease
MNKRSVGTKGEDRAVAYLETLKYKVLERNYRSHFGEIDIIAKDRSHTVFVEVKSRNSYLFGSPHESIVNKKKRRIILTAVDYMQKNHLINKPIRFDVVAINPDGSI